MQWILPLAAALLLSMSARAAETDPRLVIVSSFPEEVTEVYRNAFEAAHPGVTVEIRKKKTTAGIRYLEKPEIRGQVDLFWVSAPDAFEVLKEKKMLRRFTPTARDLPRRISGYPLHDPDGYYSGFAVSGYGIMLNTEYLTRHNLRR
ncbi:MAG TPA: ABC transporter substrate-binding protein, partial [Chromatiales bacterium]|nr:ABC transporter substrate-binding protein [Chromatiales bacterium]